MGRVLSFRPRGDDDWLSTPQPAPPARPTNPYAPPPRAPSAMPRIGQPTGRRRRRVVTATVLALAAGVVVALHHRAHDPSAVPAATTSGAAGSASSTASSATAPMSAVTWTTRQGVAFPLSPVSGPTHPNAPTASGFAHDDLGAALAAAWITFQASPSPGPAVYRAALATHVTGVGERALAATVASDYAQAAAASGVTPGAPLGEGTTTFTGYRAAAMPGGGRHVTLYERTPDANGVDQVVTLNVTLAWVDGDWKVVAPISGTWATAVAELPALPAGVVAFTPAAGAR